MSSGTNVIANVVAKADGSNTANAPQVQTLVTAGVRVETEKQFVEVIDVNDTLGNPGKVLPYSITLYGKKGSQPIGSATDNLMLEDQFNYSPNNPNNPYS